MRRLQDWCQDHGDTFFDDPRNALLALFADGLCPYDSGTYSLFAISGMILNWPPEVRSQPVSHNASCQQQPGRVQPMGGS